MSSELSRLNNESSLQPAPMGGRVNAELLIATALEKQVPIETMERLMAMRRELRQEAAKEAFISAMSAFQSECPVIEKRKDVMNKDGRSVRYSYAPLDSIISQTRELLTRHGFSYKFESTTAEKVIRATCIASHKDGHSESTSFEAAIDPDAYMNIAQKFGSALTFAKRYAFCNAFGIVTGDEDDDSESTTQKPETAREKLRRRMQENDEARGQTEMPEEQHSNEVLDYLTLVQDTTDADKLSELANSVGTTFADDEVGKLAARRAIQNRAKALGFKWNIDRKEFAKP